MMTCCEHLRHLLSPNLGRAGDIYNITTVVPSCLEATPLASKVALKAIGTCESALYTMILVAESHAKKRIRAFVDGSMATRRCRGKRGLWKKGIEI